jgi:membrane associated rhomboid family serine protease
MVPARPLSGSFLVLGARVPRACALLVGVTLAASILGAVTFRNGYEGLVGWSALVPALVLQGQVWRLVTWVFFEMDPLSLIFACLALFWFGRDLTEAWGPVRFLTSYLALAALVGGTVSALALGWTSLLPVPHLGPWAAVSGLIVAWAVIHPHRDVFLYFVLPLRGQNLIYATVAGTLLFALLHGVTPYVPHFVAEGLALLYMREPVLGNFWLRLRYRFKARGLRRVSHLRPVDRPGRDEPPKWLH